MQTENLLSRGGSYHPTNRPDEVIDDQVMAAPPENLKKVSFDDKVRINIAAKAATDERYEDGSNRFIAFEQGFKIGARAEHEYMLNR